MDIQGRFWKLVGDLKVQGPMFKGWRNLSKLGANNYHCHLTYSYVACWTYENGSYLIEVYMLVHVKEPPTDIWISGPGTEQFVADLKERYRDLVVIDEDEEYVPIEDTLWIAITAACFSSFERSDSRFLTRWPRLLAVA